MFLNSTSPYIPLPRRGTCRMKKSGDLRKRAAVSPFSLGERVRDRGLRSLNSQIMLISQIYQQIIPTT